MGSCTTHFIICGLINSCCCLLTGGLLLGFPGCFAACYACGYRKALRTKYNLQVFFLFLFSIFLNNLVFYNHSYHVNALKRKVR
ncbi:putative PLAC8 motif-containing protein [Helianthus annuus]|nr:putative PLAC8 motif-containing protein [Helianthus annuus]